jgi:hypothetical protein
MRGFPTRPVNLSPLPESQLESLGCSRRRNARVEIAARTVGCETGAVSEGASAYARIGIAADNMSTIWQPNTTGWKPALLFRRRVSSAT